MRDKKKAVFNILFLLLVFGLTVYGVFRGEDLESMMHSIRHSQGLLLEKHHIQSDQIQVIKIKY